MNFVLNLMKVLYYEGPNLPPVGLMPYFLFLICYFASLFVIYMLSLHLEIASQLPRTHDRGGRRGRRADRF